MTGVAGSRRGFDAVVTERHLPVSRPSEGPLLVSSAGFGSESPLYPAGTLPGLGAVSSGAVMTVADSRAGGGGTAELPTTPAMPEAEPTPGTPGPSGVVAPAPVGSPPGELLLVSDPRSRFNHPDSRRAVVAEAEALGPWDDGLFRLADDLVVGVPTDAPERWAALDNDLHGAFTGRRVLDVSVGSGYDALALAARGARVVSCVSGAASARLRFLLSLGSFAVTPVDADWRGLDGAVRGLEVDVVHCRGVLERSAHPLAVLMSLRRVCREGTELLLGTVILADAQHSEMIRFLPHGYGGRGDWWMVCGRLALRWMLEAAGFAVDAEIAERHLPRAGFRVVERYLRCRARPLPERCPPEPPSR